MRGLLVTLLLVPAAVHAQPGPGIDVHVDVHVDVPAPPPVEILAPPSAVPALPDRTTPRRWMSLGGSIGVGHVDGAPSDKADPAWNVRADLDVARQGPWVLGVAAAYGGDERFIYGLGPPNMYGYPSGYDGADLADTSAVAYLAHVMRRGRFELRVQGGLGVVVTQAKRWSDTVDDQQDTLVSPIAELGANVSIDLYGRLAFAIGPVATMFNQKFAPMTSDPYDRLQRGTALSLQSALRWQL